MQRSDQDLPTGGALKCAICTGSIAATPFRLPHDQSSKAFWIHLDD
ncbi:hypothetical protein EYZ11_010285 [Aspergillus tanneri]|uniref:Uncharacterized protein n=1 Tax=Aspergillus tanneri TaxID=1220188 RepID=A0A4S3J7V7_9EURO|nr:hypothetical protein EYZ11_010285 [Aspergillus tanneri]